MATHIGGIIFTAGRVKDALHQYRPSRKKRGTITQFELIVQSLSEGPYAARFLEQVLADGPPLTGGTRKRKIWNRPGDFRFLTCDNHLHLDPKIEG